MNTPSVPAKKADNLLIVQKAIQLQQVVQFKANGDWRTIAPYKVGYVKANPQLLVVFGNSRDVVISLDTPSRWQLFRLDEMHQVTLTAYSFEVLLDYEDPAYQPDSPLGSFVWLPYGLKQPVKHPRLRS